LPRRLIESQRIFTGAIFDVDRDKLLEEDGLEIAREVVRHPGGAGGLPLFDDGRVALVKQYRHPARHELLEIPAGRIERDETPVICAGREIEQEIRFRAGRMEKLAEFYSTPGFCDYLATELTPAVQSPDHDEFIELIFLPFAEAVEMARVGEIQDSKTIIALLLAELRIVS
jgi:ADP-ribose pyrophosphatase